MDVKGITPGAFTRPVEVPGLTQPEAPQGASFGSLLKDSLAQVNQLQHEADGAIESLATNDGTTSLHDTMLAVSKAELSFKLMMQVRNKIVEAYQEVVRMGV